MGNDSDVRKSQNLNMVEPLFIKLDHIEYPHLHIYCSPEDNLI